MGRFAGSCQIFPLRSRRRVSHRVSHRVDKFIDTVLFITFCIVQIPIHIHSTHSYSVYIIQLIHFRFMNPTLCISTFLLRGGPAQKLNVYVEKLDVSSRTSCVIMLHQRPRSSAGRYHQLAHHTFSGVYKRNTVSSR